MFNWLQINLKLNQFDKAAGVRGESGWGTKMYLLISLTCFLGTDRVFPRVYSLRSEQIEFQSTFLAAFFFASLSQKEKFYSTAKRLGEARVPKKAFNFYFVLRQNK